MAYGVGKKIKERREELGLTQMQLAERMGYKSKAAVCKVERGDDNITTDRVSKFAKALNCSELYLMGWEESDLKQLDFFEDIMKLEHTETINDDEVELIESYRQLNEEAKRQIVLMLAFLKEQQDKK